MNMDSSLFTMAFTLQQMGLIGFLISLIFTFYSCVYTSRLVIKSIIKTEKHIRTYDELAYVSRGKYFQLFVNAIRIPLMAGYNVVLAVMLGETTQSFMELYMSQYNLPKIM